MPNPKIKLQQNIKKLEELVKYFEEGNRDFDLDLGLKNYEEAMKIVAETQAALTAYELKIKEIQEKYQPEMTEAATDEPSM